MSTSERVAEVTLPAVAERRQPKRRRFAQNWWRHVVALIALVFALFPVAYVLSAAFNGDNSLSGSSLIPRHVTFDNFRTLFVGQKNTTGHATFQNAHYASWFANSMIVAGASGF